MAIIGGIPHFQTYPNGFNTEMILDDLGVPPEVPLMALTQVES